jgi:hypothetical protein
MRTNLGLDLEKKKKKLPLCCKIYLSDIIDHIGFQEAEASKLREELQLIRDGQLADKLTEVNTLSNKVAQNDAQLNAREQRITVEPTTKFSDFLHSID